MCNTSEKRVNWAAKKTGIFLRTNKIKEDEIKARGTPVLLMVSIKTSQAKDTAREIISCPAHEFVRNIRMNLD